TVTEREHLLAREGDPRRAFERERRHHGEGQFILRAQPGSEPAADIRRENAHLVARHFEHTGNEVSAVLWSLGLVENGDAAVAFPYRGGGERLHRVVLLDRYAIFGFDPGRRLVKGCR